MKERRSSWQYYHPPQAHHATAHGSSHQVSGMVHPLGFVRSPTVSFMASVISGMMASSCCNTPKQSAAQALGMPGRACGDRAAAFPALGACEGSHSLMPHRLA